RERPRRRGLLPRAPERSSRPRPARVRQAVALGPGALSGAARDRPTRPRASGARSGERSRGADRRAAASHGGARLMALAPRRPGDPFWLLAPTALLLAVFFFYPLVHAAHTSLFRWDLLTEPVPVGLDNYRSLWASGDLASWTLTTA